MTRHAVAGNAARLTAVGLLAGLSAALVLLFSGGHDTAQASPIASSQVSAKAVTFERTMDKLWEDHITWTRMVIVDFAAGLPDLKTAEVRLLRNQADIGNAEMTDDSNRSCQQRQRVSSHQGRYVCQPKRYVRKRDGQHRGRHQNACQRDD